MAMRDIMQGDENNPKVPMENNCRPTMPLHFRPVRTNINFQSSVRTFKIYSSTFPLLPYFKAMFTFPMAYAWMLLKLQPEG